MKYTLQSVSETKKHILDFFTNCQSLSATITKWVAGNTANTCIKNSPFMPLTGVDDENNFAPAND